MQKALTQMNIRLNMIVSGMPGLIAVKIIKVIINGEENPHLLTHPLISE